MLLPIILYKKNLYGPALFTSIVLFLWPIQKFSHYAGYADLPVLTISFLSLTIIILSLFEDKRSSIIMIFLSFVIAGAAAATKQAGLLLLPFMPFFILELNKLVNIKLENKFKLIFIGCLLYLFFALPWYLYNIYLIYTEQTNSIVPIVTVEIHEGRNLYQRLLLSISHWPGIFVMFLLAIPGLFIRGNKFISLFGIIYIIIWSLFFSYDTRNSYLAIPFLTFSIGLTCQFLNINNYYNIFIKLFVNICQIYKKYTYIIVSILLIIFICIIALNSNKINNYIYQRQNRKILYLNGHKNDNSYIVKLANNPDVVFISNENFLKYLKKDIIKNIIHFNFNSNNFINNKEILKNIIDNNKNKIIYFVISKNTNIEKFKNEIENIKLIYNGHYIVYKLVN
jgi:4-amino-4-deoxy-L-arabinose transferase-like glycosyltransferase